ncbi:hypothetical protein OG455_25895 [Kitasatospora sp. NBC_01287]|uniref:hypothetical protein n=1 Tax=Kitasatospora sp. NBC_01287 TaxID=2903573 RepID=UPI00225AFFE7|nr:hypothetical protein [Kitasatospora sp. NBC_01287]MCX4748908.1 hypothetical protein [Kitasatospora sp. NBC_01287]
MKVLRVGCAAVIVIAVLVAAFFGYSIYHSRQIVAQSRRKAHADAELVAQRFATELVPAFEAGPQSADSLTQQTGLSGFVEMDKQGTSLVVYFGSSREYADGWMGTLETVCYKDTLSRRNGEIGAHLESSNCITRPKLTVPSDQMFSVG